MGLHLHFGVDLREGAARALDLGDAHVGRAVNHLALQVREIDRVVVDYTQRADTGRGQILQEGCAEAAGADHQDFRRDELRLADAADLRQHDMSRVAADLRFRQGR